MGPLMQVSGSGTVPIVFVIVPDPVGAGYVDSLARPGGSATGFSLFEYSIGGKWLDLLKQVAPTITRVAALRDPAISGGLGQYGAVQSAASSFGVEASAINMRDATEIEHAVTAFAATSGGGLIVTGSALGFVHRGLIVTLAARHKLPSIYFDRVFVAEGGLICVHRARREVFGNGFVPIKKGGNAGCGADCIIDFNTLAFQNELVCCHKVYSLLF